MSKNDEQILVVSRELFDTIGSFEGVSLEPQKYLEAFFAQGNNFFMRRGDAETDPSFKQIIPYVVFTHAGKILYYVRGGTSGETRLIAKGSIGIGGHVNDTDYSGDGKAAYIRAVEREITEELAIESSFSAGEVVALINDDSTEVGRVHLGVVHRVELETPAVAPSEAAIAEMTFLDPAELRPRADSLESWSRLLLTEFFRND